MKFSVTQARVGTGIVSDEQRLIKLLITGWEPFGVTESTTGYVYHFRRDASILDEDGGGGSQ